jgi:glycosyltransferase involved in cell wall biosynthesis
VATALPTHQEVLDEQTAFLVDPSPGGLAQGLIRAFHDPGEAERRGRAARALVDERHNYRVFKQQIGLIYASLGRVAATDEVSAYGASDQ